MANMSANIYQEAHDGLIAIVLPRLLPYMSTVTLAFHLWPPKSLGFVLLPGLRNHLNQIFSIMN